MSLRKKIFVSAGVGITILTFFLFCSNFNDSNNVGDEILSDPDLTSFDKNFLTFSGDSTQALQSFSIPNGSPYRCFGVHSGMITIGGKGIDTATGYVKFLIDTTYDKTLKNFKSGDSILSIIIKFDTLVLNYEKSDPSHIRIQSCLNDSASSRRSPDTGAVYNDTLKMQISDSKTSFLIDTVSPVLRDSIFKACTSYKPISTAFSLFNQGSGLCRLKNPNMTIKCIRKDTTKTPTKTDTISQTLKPYYYNYVAYESNTLIDSLSSRPISSYSSGRTAVFKIDLQPLWNKIDSSKQANFNEILSASFMIKGQSQFSNTYIKLDTTKNADSAKISYSTIKYGYYFSTVPVEDGYSLKDALYSKVKTDTITSGKTILMPVDEFLRPLLGAERPSFGYLYIGITNPVLPGSNDLWNKVIWGKPLLKAVATTLKR